MFLNDQQVTSKVRNNISTIFYFKAEQALIEIKMNRETYMNSPLIKPDDCSFGKIHMTSSLIKKPHMNTSLIK